MTAYKNMIFAVKSYGKSRLIYLNLILVLAIVMILFFQNYKKTISLDCAYGKNPIGIILLIQNHFPSCKHPLKAVMIFNELPDKQDIEMMGKIHKKYSHQVDIAAMFLKRFKVENTIGFPYHFFPNKKILCASGERQFKKNYFLLLHENRVNYIDSVPHPQVLAFLLDKNLKGKVTDDFLEKRELEARLLKRLNQGKVYLWNLGTNRMEHFDWGKTSATFNFYHSGCSSCELKRILEHINLEQARSEQANIHVFSFQANLTDLQANLSASSAYLKIYLDKEDCFDLGFAETGHIENPIMIQKRNSVGVRNEIN